jgi:hypothetical protein
LSQVLRLVFEAPFHSPLQLDEMKLGGHLPQPLDFMLKLSRYLLKLGAKYQPCKFIRKFKHSFYFGSSLCKNETTYLKHSFPLVHACVKMKPNPSIVLFSFKLVKNKIYPKHSFVLF